jgi:hypothetical protein
MDDALRFASFWEAVGAPDLGLEGWTWSMGQGASHGALLGRGTWQLLRRAMEWNGVASHLPNMVPVRQSSIVGLKALTAVENQ